MNLLKEIEQSETAINVMIDMLGAHLSTLLKAKAVLQKGGQPSGRAEARRRNRSTIMQEIIRLDMNPGKPRITKRK